jgi:hypothetical protein
MIYPKAIIQKKAIKKHKFALVAFLLLGIFIFIGCLWLEHKHPLFCTLLSNLSTLINALGVNHHATKIKEIQNDAA